MSFPSDAVTYGKAFNARLSAGAGGVVAMLSALSVAAEASVWTPAAGKKFRLTGFDLAGSAAGEYVFRDNTAGTVVLRVYLAANAPRTIMLPGSGLLSGAINRPLTVVGPATATLTGTLFGYEE